MQNTLSEYTESELYVLLHTEHREAAFAELYSRLSPIIFSYTMRVLGDRDRAYDVFQETFIRLYQSAERKQFMDNVRGYALTICRNLCLNEKKRTMVQNVVFDDAVYNPGESRDDDRKEMLRLINMALDLLSHDLKEAFVLREYDGLTYQEISELLNVKLDTAKVRVFRARQRIKEILEPYLSDFTKD